MPSKLKICNPATLNWGFSIHDAYTNSFMNFLIQTQVLKKKYGILRLVELMVLNNWLFSYDSWLSGTHNELPHWLGAHWCSVENQEEAKDWRSVNPANEYCTHFQPGLSSFCFRDIDIICCPSFPQKKTICLSSAQHVTLLVYKSNLAF